MFYLLIYERLKHNYGRKTNHNVCFKVTTQVTEFNK